MWDETEIGADFGKDNAQNESDMILISPSS